MDEYTRNQLKNFVKESIPSCPPPNEDNVIPEIPLRKGTTNVIIGNHNLVFTNAFSLIIFLATVLFAVAFF